MKIVELTSKDVAFMAAQILSGYIEPSDPGENVEDVGWAVDMALDVAQQTKSAIAIREERNDSD